MPDNNKIFTEENKAGETPKRKSKWNAVLWAAVLVLAVGNIVAISRVNDTQTRLDQMTKAMNSEINGLQNQAHDLHVRADTNEAMLRSEVEKTQKIAKTESFRARKLAEKKAAEEIKRLAEEYQKQGREFRSEIGGVRADAKHTGARVSSVIDEVDGVRGDVAQTQTDLGETRAELRSVRGDLGIQSGLIATNAGELAELRRLGERNYYEFAITKDGKAYKVGNIAVMLRKTKPNRGRFTLDVIADDKRVEKKDRTINEPIQFYTSMARQPYELVVNEVAKGKVVGYLAVPKVVSARLQAK